MSTELAATTTSTTLAEQIDFARMVTASAERSSQSILPDAYRGNPANVLIAVGLGASMGLSPAESLYRIAVIKGKPTAGAELIASNVRKAGHRLRVVGDDTSCTATIIRNDDKDFEFSVTRDVAWAKSMGLIGNDNYKKQAGTMLQWRAITAVARQACPEALYGVVYEPSEMYDMDGGQPSSQRGPVAAAPVEFVAEPAATVTMSRRRATPEPVDADVVDDTPPTGGAAESVATDTSGPTVPSTPAVPSDLITAPQMKKLHALMNEQGMTDRALGLGFLSDALGREVESSKTLTRDEAHRVIERLEAPDPSEPPLTGDEDV